jgi:hypothetical protein
MSLHSSTLAVSRVSTRSRRRAPRLFDPTRLSEPGGTESFQHNGRLLTREDEHEPRALELEAMNYHRQAALVRRCGAPDGRVPRCRQRLCPTCSQKLALSHAVKTERAIRAMSTQGGMTRVETVSAIWDALKRLRRQKCFKDFVLGGVGGLDLKVVESGRVWLPHFHLTLHMTPVEDLDAVFEAMARSWRELTDGRGTFEPAKRRFVLDSGAKDVACYSAKSRSPKNPSHGWCPQPGTLSLDQLNHLLWAVKGRRLRIAWGTAKPKAIEEREERLERELRLLHLRERAMEEVAYAWEPYPRSTCGAADQPQPQHELDELGCWPALGADAELDNLLAWPC